MDLAVAPGTARLDEFPGHLGKRPGDQQVLPVGLIETDRVGNGNLACGSAGAGPLVDSGGQGDSESDGRAFAVAQQFDVALGRLIIATPAVGQPDGDLLGNQAGLVHTGKVPCLALPALLPVEGEHRVAVLAMDGVDLHSRGTIANLHDTAAAFSLPGHQARCLCQLCWNSCWKTCLGHP